MVDIRGMKNRETILNLNSGGEAMAVGFDRSHLSFAIREKGWKRRDFRDALVKKCIVLGVPAPSDSALSSWFMGKNEPRASYIRVMALVLDKPMEFFCGGEVA